MNAHQRKLNQALVLVGELMDDIHADFESWDEDCKCAYMFDQLDEAYSRLDIASRLMREA